MDHLPLPSDPVPPVIEVPYVCKTLYDEGSFDDYPVRQGITIDSFNGSIDVLTFFERRFEDQISFVQTWLYFGVLQQFFGPLFRHTNFRRSSSGRAVVTSEQLPHLLEEWKIHRKNKSTIEIPNRDCLDRLFRTACSTFELLNQKNRSTLREPFPSILLSIDVLLTTRLLFTHLDYTRGLMNANPCHHEVPSTSALYNHILESGWCRHQLEHLFPCLLCCALYFLASLRRHVKHPSNTHALWSWSILLRVDHSL
jgi:hypothetical protein